MSDLKTEGTRVFRAIHGLGDGKRNDSYDEGWEDAIEACEGAVTELFGVDYDDAYSEQCTSDECDEPEGDPCPVCRLFDQLEQLFDEMPRNDFDRGWNNAVKACMNTFKNFIACELDEEDEELCAGDGKEEESDPINSPSWYTFGGIETLDFILAKRLDFLLGQVVKYISRSGRKDPAKELEDLRKAQFYLNKKIELMEATE